MRKLDMKKNFCQNEVFSLFHEEANLIRGQSNGKDKWYIIFKQGSDLSNLQSFRPTFDINRIKSRKERKEVAADIIDLINEGLERGELAHSLIAKIKGLALNGKVKKVINPYPQRQKPVIDAIDEIYLLKIQDAPDRSKETYKHICDHFKRFLVAKNLEQKHIVDFNKSNALGFMDFLWLRKIAACTYNNRLTEIKNLFNELLRRDYILDNPFSNIPEKKKKAGTKATNVRRRIFTDEEAAIVGRAIFEKSIWLFRAILLENYCGVRPAELRRLKFKHFNFSNGTIDLSGEVVYKSKARIATIPKAAMEYFLMKDFLRQNASNFVFGALFIPNPNKPVSRNYITMHHRAILLNLKESGMLQDITGLELYSWKNKGITDYANDESVGIFRTSNQVGHHSTTETMRYYRQSPVDEAIRKYNKKIF